MDAWVRLHQKDNRRTDETRFRTSTATSQPDFRIFLRENVIPDPVERRGKQVSMCNNGHLLYANVYTPILIFRRCFHISALFRDEWRLLQLPEQSQPDAAEAAAGGDARRFDSEDG